ncbi:hypothetical protein R3P38DRAFT_3035626 [Favolaschia claudopus]|uniref:C2H2-type domain-containing protein n=1 Tax=Favolaschia claudopus TaxID=2862362 RepID=A0AAW0AET0_9AGAR
MKCSWNTCGRRFADVDVLAKHVDAHYVKTILCAYENCYEAFKSTEKLVKHHRLHEKKGDKLKRSFMPSPPTLVVPPSLDSTTYHPHPHF